MTREGDTVCSVHDLTVRYPSAGSDVLHQVSLEVGRGEIVAVLGHNGAGKSTLLKGIAGLVPSTGRVLLHGEAIEDSKAWVRCGLGVRYVPQRENVFGFCSVEKNLRLGGYSLDARTRRERSQRILEWFPMLKGRLTTRADVLSGGQRQLLALAIGLMGEPGLLLLDEPGAGLSPVARQDIMELVSTLRSNGTSILMADQNIEEALVASDRAYILRSGRVSVESASADLLKDEGIWRRL